MNEDKILEAMGFIDDSLIEEAEKLRKNHKRKFPIAKAGLIAACLLLVAAGIILVYPVFFGGIAESDNTNADHAEAGSPALEKEEDIGFTAEENNSDKESENGKPSVSVESVYGDDTVLTDITSISYVPMRLTVEYFTQDGFICTVADCAGSDTFSDGEKLTVIYSSELRVPETLCEGDTVYVTYSILSDSEGKIYAHRIYYTEGETTPAYYGGKK